MMQKHKIPKSKCDKTLAKLASGDSAPVVVKEFGTYLLLNGVRVSVVRIQSLVYIDPWSV